MFGKLHVTAVIPALNEARAISHVLNDIHKLYNDEGLFIIDHVIVCDNGSSDNTATIARTLGAQVTYEPEPGYGAACLSALSKVYKTDVVVFIDADASLQIDETTELLSAIINGADLAIGARLPKLQQPGAMSLPQKWGNVIAGSMIRWMWHVPVTDLGPFRAIRYEALRQLNMQDRSFGWTVEMQVKAIQHGIPMIEVPVHYRKRIGQSKISGTFMGVVGAAIGIISTIIKLATNPPTTEIPRLNQ